MYALLGGPEMAGWHRIPRNQCRGMTEGRILRANNRRLAVRRSSEGEPQPSAAITRSTVTASCIAFQLGCSSKSTGSVILNRMTSTLGIVNVHYQITVPIRRSDSGQVGRWFATCLRAPAEFDRSITEALYWTDEQITAAAQGIERVKRSCPGNAWLCWLAYAESDVPRGARQMVRRLVCRHFGTRDSTAWRYQRWQPATRAR